MLRIGVVAGEASGDLLGAGLIQAIRRRHPDAVFEGIAGPQMMAQGCNALFPAERLSVMGLVEVLGRLRELLGIRRQLAQHFLANPPDVFIGIDAPDFNLGLEAQLKQAGIPTVHYVSPSVWAWRQYRVRRIGRSVDLILTLFPFEADFYRAHSVPVRFVGHPLADTLPLESDPAEARRALGLPAGRRIVALLPGSRTSEVSRLAPCFVQTAAWCARRRPDLHFVVPLVNGQTRALFERALGNCGAELSITLLHGQSHQAMAAADVVLLASGTAALEAMLLKRPMVVAYRVTWLTALLARWLLKVPYVSLPNLLAQRRLVEEYLQDDATPDRIGPALLRLLEDPAAARVLHQTFHDIHLALRHDASRQAAEAVLEIAACRAK